VQRFAPLHPDAKDVLTFDFSAGLLDGETLVGPPVLSVKMRLGADTSPASLFNGTSQIDATSMLVLVPVQGRVEGAEYELECQCATTNTKKYFALSAVLPIAR
jgi:hypothetical protein